MELVRFTWGREGAAPRWVSALVRCYGTDGFLCGVQGHSEKAAVSSPRAESVSTLILEFQPPVCAKEASAHLALLVGC